MNKQKSKEILDILKGIIKNPAPELDFKNPYELIIAVVLSAQTTDKRVNSVTKDLFLKYPSSKDLASADYSLVKEIISPLGLSSTKAKNIIALAKELDLNHGIVPSSFDSLIKLPGVGRKTANVVLALGFNIPAMPVDTHLYRMAIRLGYIRCDMDIVDAEIAYKKYIPKDEWTLAHHLFLLFGRYYCKALHPLCDNCKLKNYCKYKG
ncbi:MAG: endonuclease III [Acholeplasmatales bacterium]|nr:endonuclease III [Acholeplasmatales bacterium]